MSVRSVCCAGPTPLSAQPEASVTARETVGPRTFGGTPLLGSRARTPVLLRRTVVWLVLSGNLGNFAVGNPTPDLRCDIPQTSTPSRCCSRRCRAVVAAENCWAEQDAQAFVAIQSDLKWRAAALLLAAAALPIHGCSVASDTYKATKGAVKTTYGLTKGAVILGVGAGKLVYRIGDFTFDVVTAPLDWPLLQEDIETVDGLSPKDAIRSGRVKTAPYVVKGKRYVPMSVEQAKHYREQGVASWYGYETRRLKGGHMTANGEAFDPMGLTAAHKHLPLPTFVRVTNLENGRSLIVRVNDRGPFIDGRIIDLSAGAAKRLGFYGRGLARVRVEAAG